MAPRSMALPPDKPRRTTERPRTSPATSPAQYLARQSRPGIGRAGASFPGLFRWVVEREQLQRSQEGKPKCPNRPRIHRGQGDRTRAPHVGRPRPGPVVTEARAPLAQAPARRTRARTDQVRPRLSVPHRPARPARAHRAGKARALVRRPARRTRARTDQVRPRLSVPHRPARPARAHRAGKARALVQSVQVPTRRGVQVPTRLQSPAPRTPRRSRSRMLVAP